MTTYLWNEDKGMFVDYNTETKEQSPYEYVTTLYALWSGIATPAQAAALVSKAVPKFECVGGLSCCTESSRGPVTASRPQRQWDYPFGWAPHQMLAWDGLKRYGYIEDMERLAYRWLQIMTQAAMDFNAAIAEKYDVTQLENPVLADSEYGNQGLAFKGANLEGYFSHPVSLL
jgi:alpha,alpha-trehalase